LFSDKEKIATELDVSHFRHLELSVICVSVNSSLRDIMKNVPMTEGRLPLPSMKVTSKGAPAKSIPMQSVPEQQKTKKNNDKKP
uniref:SRP9-21 domain-containing protein n=1 Tax=Ascaris lumbricoides TaxID=6252 RepID=A0A0M3IUF5_ASCLU